MSVASSLSPSHASFVDAADASSGAAVEVSRRDRRCAWCSAGISETSRVDARYCSTRCRQAGHRASIRRVELARDGSPLRFAYADPPYPGQASIYRGHPDYRGEVDVPSLLSRLEAYDGWALSTSVAGLPTVLALCVAQGLDVRVASWIRGVRPHATAQLLNGWEPVVFAGQRRMCCGDRGVTDVLEGVTPRRRSTHPGWLVGSKPPAFCEWVFDLLGAGCHPDDTLDDLYPGSGIVARSWSLRVAVR